MKVFQYLKRHLSEFGIVGAGWEWDKKDDAFFWFHLEQNKLEPIVEWMGPVLKQKDHVSAFKEKHTDTFEKDNRIYARVQREHTTPESMIGMLLKDNYIKDRVRKILI